MLKVPLSRQIKLTYESVDIILIVVSVENHLKVLCVCICGFEVSKLKINKSWFLGWKMNKKNFSYIENYEKTFDKITFSAFLMPIFERFLKKIEIFKLEACLYQDSEMWNRFFLDH